MDRLGDQLLAGPAFAGDEDGGVGLGDPLDQPVDPPHRLAAAIQRAEVAELAQVSAQARDVRLQRVGALDVRQHASQPVAVERFRQIVEGTALQGCDRGLRGSVTGHDDILGVAESVRVADQGEAVSVGERQIDEHRIDGGLREGLARLLERRHFEAAKPFALDERDECTALVDLVFDDQQRQLG